MSSGLAQRSRWGRGFTLVELLIVMGIIGDVSRDPATAADSERT